MVETPEEDTIVNTGSNFYKRYSGTIAGKPVVVNLHRYGNIVQGEYYYTAIGQSIQLRDWNDSVKDASHLLLTEIASHAQTEGAEDANPGWTLQLSGNGATGEWRSGDGQQTYPIVLSEDYPAGSTMLHAFWMTDSAALLPDNPKSPIAAASYAYLLPRAQNDFLYDALKEQIAPNAPQGDDVAEALQTTIAEYFDSYRKENGDIKLGKEPELEAFTFSYTDDEAVYVHYNDDNWLVTERFSSAYTGGAHGNYGSSFANIDLAGKRIWHLTDIVADTNALRPVLNDAAIAYFRLKQGSGMHERLLVDEVPPTANVYLGNKGLSFVYNPYEIASYADGQITLFLPYQKLLPLLTPAFKQRMRLSEGTGTAML